MEWIWYGLLGLGVIAFIWLLFKRIRPMWRKIIMLLLSLGLILFSGFNILVPVHPIVEPTGELEVALAQEYYRYTPTDPAHQTAANIREVPLMIWYPEDIAQANGRLVLFSHGSLGIADSNDSLFNELASHGYVVGSLGHPYHSFTTTLEDGSAVNIDFAYMQSVLNQQGSDDLEGTWQQLESWSQMHEDDLREVLREIRSQGDEHAIFSEIDPERVILAGHSLGGTAVLDLGRELSGLSAVIALEAPFSGDILEVVDRETYLFTDEPYPHPLLHIYSDATWDVLDEWVLYAQNYRFLQLNGEQYENVHVEGAGHLGLTDMSRVTPIFTNLFDGGLNTDPYGDNLKEINEAVLLFLENIEED